MSALSDRAIKPAIDSHRARVGQNDIFQANKASCAVSAGSLSY